MFFELFVFMSLWWWLLFAAYVVADIFFLENDNGTWATISLLLFGAAVFFFGDWNPLPGMIADPLGIVMLVVYYFGGGAVWSVIKWYFHSLNIRDKYREVKARFFDHNGIVGDKIPQKLIQDWEHTVARNFMGSVPPKALENKGKIMMWMTHWPFSFVWTVLNDPIRRAFQAIYSRVAGLLQKISDMVFKDEIVEYDDD